MTADAPPHGPIPSGAIEVRSIDYVPEADRHGKVWTQGPFWCLGNLQPYTVALGFIGPSLGLSLGWTIVASVLGIAVGTFFMAFHASQGPWLGLPQMIQSRAQLGYRGVIIALAGTLFSFVGFNVIDAVIIDSGLEGIFGWNRMAVGIVITIAAVILAIYGHDWLHRVFRVLLWLSLPFWLLLTVCILTGKATGRAHVAGDFTLVAFMTQVTVCASYNVTYAPYVSDYTRYLPRRVGTPRIVASVFIGAAASPIWLIPIGAWLATRLGATDTLVGIRDAGNSIVDGLGLILVVPAVLALVATMGLNAYSGMLTVVTGLDSFRKVTPTRRIRIVTIMGLAVVWAVIGIGLITDFSSALSNAQLIMLYLLTPWTAINLVDYFFVRRGHYAITDLFRPDGIYGAWAWRGLVSYGAGLASMVPFVALTFFTGPVAEAFNKVDIAFLVGLAVSAGLYYTLTRSLDLDAEQPAVDDSERELATA